MRDLLAEPGDLLLRTKVEDLVDDDGNVDRDKARAAAEALVKDRPELAKRKVTGDAGQGPRGATMPEPYDFSERLRAAAG